MDWIEIIWPMLTGASLLVAVAYVVVGFSRRANKAYIALATVAVSVAALALLELAIYRTSSPEEMAIYIRWMHVPITGLVLSFLYLLHDWSGHTPPQIAIAAGVLRVLALVINFIVGENLNFLSISDIEKSTWWGVSVSNPIGIANPWVIVAQISNALVLIYIGQTMFYALRKRKQNLKEVMTIGSSWFLMATIMIASSLLMTLDLSDPPLIAAPGFAIVIVTIIYFRMNDLIRSHRIEMELRESELLRLHAEREVAMERANLAHLSRVNLLGEISGSIIHELNHPLAAILSNAQVAQQMLRRDPLDMLMVQEILSDIVDNDRRAGDIIQGIRRLMKKDAQQYAPLSINDVIEDCLRVIRSELQHRRITLHVDLSRGLPLFLGDSVQLQQVMLNLIVNSCEAMQSLTADRTLLIRTGSSSEGILVEVIDTGTGIPEEIIERMFEPFETLKHSGMGMGLAICQSIIEAHGGDIHAENITPHGARIFFTLPQMERSHGENRTYS